MGRGDQIKLKKKKERKNFSEEVIHCIKYSPEVRLNLVIKR